MDEHSWKKQFNEKTTVPPCSLKTFNIVLYPSISTGTINKQHGDKLVSENVVHWYTPEDGHVEREHHDFDGFDVSLNGLRFPLKMDPVTMEHHE